MLETRIKLFVALPIDKLDRMAIKRKVDEIGCQGRPQDWSCHDVGH